MSAINAEKINWWEPAGYYDPELLARMATEAESQIVKFSQQNLANLAWAYGKLLHYERGLMDAIAQQATIKLKAYLLPIHLLIYST